MKKNVYQKLSILMLIVVSFLGCEKDNYTENNDPNSLFNLIQQKNDYNLSEYEKQDQIKIVVGEALGDLIKGSQDFRLELINNLINNNKETVELLYIQNKNKIFKNGKSLETLFLEYFKDDSEKLNLITEIENQIPNLVIKIPDWANVIFKNVDNYKGLEFSIYPGLRIEKLFNQKNNIQKKSNSNTLADYIPIQIKESEKLLPLNKNNNSTIWNDDLIEDHFPSLAGCTDFERDNYTTYSNDVYDFVDRVRLNNDLQTTALCGVPLSTGNNTGSSNCAKIYERDCVSEKNVIEGFKFLNYQSLKAVNNQPGGEDLFVINYVFSVASMCGNLDETKICPPTDWKLIIPGDFNSFFETQFYWGTPPANDANISFKGKYLFLDYYMKSIPKYYDIPIEISDEQIYSQARFLLLSNNSTWDGNKYGDAITMAIYEHDNVIIKQTTSNSIVMNNSTKISNKLKVGEIFESGSTDFSNSVTRTSTTTVVIEAEKDVELGKRPIIYYDKNFNLPNNGFGYNLSTGIVNTHFAFYY